MPCSRVSESHDDYVPALCTHRPSLILMAELTKSGDDRAPFGTAGGASTGTGQANFARGIRSRNKVSVGEPAEGSLRIVVVLGSDPLVDTVQGERNVFASEVS